MKVSFGKKMGSDPTIVRGVKVDYGAAKRVFPKLRWYAVLLVITSPVFYFVGTITWNSLQVRCPGLVVSHTVEVRAEEGGTVDTVYVAPGESVDSGQIVCTVLRTETSRWFVPVRQNAASAAGDTRAEWDARLQRAREEAEHLLKALKNTQFLKQEGAATAAEADAAQRRYRLALDNLEAVGLARSDALRKAGLPVSRQEPVEVETVRAYQYRAPWKGSVLAVKAIPHQLTTRNENLVTLQREPASYWTVAFLKPAHARYAVTGRKARVLFDDGTKAMAVVARVSGMVEAQHEAFFGPIVIPARRLPVKIEFTEELDGAQSIVGMPVKVHFWRWEWNRR